MFSCVAPLINKTENFIIFEVSNKLFNHLGTGCKVYHMNTPETSNKIILK
jgi:hypothetical protein